MWALSRLGSGIRTAWIRRFCAFCSAHDFLPLSDSLVYTYCSAIEQGKAVKYYPNSLKRRGYMSRRVITLLTVGLLLVGIIGSATYSWANGATDDATLPPIAEKAINLQKSLSPEQQKAISAVLGSYQPELTEIAKRLPGFSVQSQKAYLPVVKQSSSSGVQATSSDRSTATTAESTQSSIAALKIAQDVAIDVQAVQAKIDTDIAAILTPDQLAQYREVMQSSQLAPKVTDTSRVATSADVTPQASVVSCGIAAQRASLARYYAVRSQSFAYVNFFARGTVSSELAYRNLVFAQSEALMGLQNIGGSYADLISAVPYLDYNGLGGTGERNEIAVRDNADKGSANALIDFIASGGFISGSPFAYYANFYGIAARDNAILALLEVPGCYS